MKPLHRPWTLISTLAADAMYFQAAREAFSQASQSTRYIDRARRKVEDLQQKIDDVSRMPDDGEEGRSLNHNKLESLSIQMEGAEYRLGEAYGPMLQNLAAVHILCVAAVEAHVNIQAQAHLKGRNWAAFERLQVEAKWLFLPKLIGLAGFDPGKQPFQAFDSLLHTRNKLVHYRVHKEPWGSPGVPEFLTALGLSFECGEQSLAAVQGMVTMLAQQLKQDPPYWLTRPKANFFEVKLDD